MTTHAPAAAEGAGTRRHKLAGDVHLILLSPAGEILLGQRHNTGYEDGAWHVPSGHLEAGESVIATLVREAKNPRPRNNKPRRPAWTRPGRKPASSRALSCLTCGNPAHSGPQMAHDQRPAPAFSGTWLHMFEPERQRPLTV
jgi:hypothetical protein